MITIILLKMNRELALANGKWHAFLMKTPYILLVCLILAQPFAFRGLITQLMLPFAIEETLWGVGFLLVTPLVFTRLFQLKRMQKDVKSYRVFLIILAVWCCGYGAFQWLFMLPFTHFPAIAQDAGNAIPPDALRQAIFSFIATRDFDRWGGIGFFVWHSGYFSICTWMALDFMTAPRLKSKL